MAAIAWKKKQFRKYFIVEENYNKLGGLSFLCTCRDSHRPRAGSQGRSRADYVAADAAADVGDRWLRQTSSLLHSGGHDNVEKEEVNSGA